MKRFSVYYHCRSDVGNFRKYNEDTVLVAQLSDQEINPGAYKLDSSSAGILAMICDGVGGENAGDVASKLASAKFFQFLQEYLSKNKVPVSENSRIDLLNEITLQVHQILLREMEQDRRLDGMASTLTGLWIIGDSATMVHVGDSRIIRFRGGELEQLSKDQSPVGKIVLSGILTEEEARLHPKRNIVNQVVGGSSTELFPDCETFELCKNDIYILCSDGLTDSLDSQIIRKIINANLGDTVSKTGDCLLDAALTHDGRDNISLAILRIGSERSHPLSIWWNFLFHP